MWALWKIVRCYDTPLHLPHKTCLARVSTIRHPRWVGENTPSGLSRHPYCCWEIRISHHKSPPLFSARYVFRNSPDTGVVIAPRPCFSLANAHPSPQKAPSNHNSATHVKEALAKPPSCAQHIVDATRIEAEGRHSRAKHRPPRRVLPRWISVLAVRDGDVASTGKVAYHKDIAPSLQYATGTSRPQGTLSIRTVLQAPP